jgi:lysozyme family protein
MDLTALKTANAERWAKAKVTKRAEFVFTARRLILPNAKARYQAVEAKTGVPWFFVAVVHERECSQSWAGSLAQGDAWDRPSVHVPVGIGPFKSWEDAAVYALVNCEPCAARNNDWSVGAFLTKLEEYNGLGYAVRGIPSPYIWSGTDQYKSGKYIRDGVFDPDKVDEQLGCAGLLMAMMALDRTISVDGKAPPVVVDLPDIPKPDPVPQPKPPAPPTNWWTLIVSIFRAIFKSK